MNASDELALAVEERPRRDRSVETEAARSQALERRRTWQGKRDDEAFVASLEPFLCPDARRRAAQVRRSP